MSVQKSARVFLGALLMLGFGAASAMADVAVSTNVNSVTQVTTGGSSPTLTLTTVNSTTNRFNDATDNSSATYSVFNDAAPVGTIKIKGSFTGDTLPDGLELKLALTAPSDAGTSSGTKTFTGANQTTEQILVTGITTANQGAGSQNKAISFTLHQATGTAVTATTTSVDVTLVLTIIDE